MEPSRVVHPSADILRALALGKLDESKTSAVRSHVDSCSACRAAVAANDNVPDRARQGSDSSGTQVPADSFAEPADPPLPAPPVNLPPELADNPDYEVLRELGRGGMGVVYQARHKLSGRLEVLKVMNKALIDQPESRERFLREIQAAARLDHRNVVKMHTAIERGELMMLVIEYVDGEDLARVLKARGSLPVLYACHYIVQAACGLQHAHEKGMVHRDIKPQNLMLIRENKKHTVKVLDFGLAKATRSENVEAGLTGTGAMMGTPGYMAPEQSLDAATADIRADVYSLGCTLYQMLTGAPPFSGKSLFEILQAHHSKEAKPLSELRPEVPEELAAVVRKMMAKDPAQRYQTPAEVMRALDPFIKVGPKPAPTPVPVKEVREVAAPVAIVLPRPEPEVFDVLPVVADSQPKSLPPRRAASKKSRRTPSPPEVSTRANYGSIALLAGLLLFGLIGMGTVLVFAIRAARTPASKGPTTRPPIVATKPNGIGAPTTDATEPDSRLVRMPNGTDPNPSLKEEPPTAPPETRASVTNSIGMKLALVRPGVFLMGSPQNGLERGRDEFQHEVEITRPFHVGIHEVTQEQYQRVVGHNPSYFSPTGDGKDEIGNQDTRQFPVEYVSWEEAVRFCRLLSELPEEKAQNRTYRLPTEAEWEYVCRGGPFSPKPSLTFYFGNSLSATQANFDGNHPYGVAEKGDSLKRTTKAGSYLPNRLRVYDLHGNVREWCADWYDADYYERSPRQDPQGPENGERRVLRGGAWFSSGFDCRTAYRNFDLPSDRNSNIGFRVVMDSGARN